MSTTRRSGTLLHRSVLAVAAATMTTATPPASGQDPPQSFELSTVIRDFSRDHPDFDVDPEHGYGWYHGNVAYDLDEEGKPVFTGGGFRAATLWRDSERRPISPHLFNTCGFVGGGAAGGGATSFRLTASERVDVERGAVIDGFDSNAGPYGGDNAGDTALVRVNGRGRNSAYVRLRRDATVRGDVLVHPDDNPDRAVAVDRDSEVTGLVDRLETPVEIPDVAMPQLDLGAAVGKVDYTGADGVITEDLHCRQLRVSEGATLTVRGDVTLWCDERLWVRDGAVLEIDGNVTVRTDDRFDVDDAAEVRLLDGATLAVYAAGKVRVSRKARLNDGGDPQAVGIFLPRPDGDDDNNRVELTDGSRVTAWVHGPAADLVVDDGAELTGSFMGRGVRVRGSSRVHVDMATAGGGGAADPHECDLGDTPGSVLVMSNGDVTSAGTFADWWRDVLGLNLSMVMPLEFTRDPRGVYGFRSSSFRPIDGLLLGNEGDIHNYHFTVELDASFVYEAGTGQWLQVRASDDVYVFINGRLVIDLGGYGWNTVLFVDMDRLGLPDGEPARLQLFHAQRQRGLGIFMVETTFPMADNARGASVSGIIDD